MWQNKMIEIKDKFPALKSVVWRFSQWRYRLETDEWFQLKRELQWNIEISPEDDSPILWRFPEDDDRLEGDSSDQLGREKPAEARSFGDNSFGHGWLSDTP